MFRMIYNRFLAFRDANKEPFKDFTDAWMGKSRNLLWEEKFNLTVWIVFGFLSVGISIIFCNPLASLPKVINDIISLNFYGYLLFSGATIGLIPLLIRRSILQVLIAVGNVLMKGALHGSALLIGVLLSILIVGGLSGHEKPNGFFLVFSLGILYTALLMTYTVFGLSFSEAYKTFQPKLRHKIWLFLLFLICFFCTYYIVKH